MKMKNIKRVEYAGGTDTKALIVCFQTQILITLRKRGMLSEQQLVKGLSILKVGR